jgi:hypothetical protein
VSQRIKGQDTTLTIFRSGQMENTLTDVVSFNATFKFEKLPQRYLGETTIRYDEIFGGVEGKVKLHLHSEAFTLYIQAVEARARRQQPTTVFNFTTTLTFPNGDSPVFTFPDVKFGDIPLDVPGGKEFVSIDLDWSCEEFDCQQ